MTATFDPRAVWRSLPDDAMETIGTMAVAEAMASLIIVEVGGDVADTAITVVDRARVVIEKTLINTAQPALFEEDGSPRLPMVEGLG